MTYKLLERELLPKWFEYPQVLLDLLASEEIDFGPWQLLLGEGLSIRHAGLKKRYPNLELVPFARRFDDDDVACFDVSVKCSTPKVKIIHDFASPGWAEREEYENFNAWLQEVRAVAKDWED